MRRFFTSVTAPAQVRRIFEIFFRRRGFRNPAGARTIAEAQRVLIARPDHLGDIILTSPFLREFRKSWPHAEITLLVSSEWRSLVEHCPYVDHIETHQRFRAGRFGRIRRLAREVSFARRHLWPHRFDLAVVPRWDTQLFREGILAYLSGARWRVGFTERGNTIPRSDEPCEMLYTNLAPSGPPQHEVEKSLSLLTWMGGTVSQTRTEVWIDAADREFAAARLPNAGAGEPVARVVMVPGSSSPSRRWPTERFGALAAWMVEELGWEVVLAGSKSEAALGAIVERRCPRGIVNLIGATSVRQTMAVIERCRLYVGNDTGPMHMAAALDLPTVEISCHPADGSRTHERSPARFRPWGVPVWIAQPATGVDDCREFCVPGEAGEPHCVLAVSMHQVERFVMEAAEACGIPIGQPEQLRRFARAEEAPLEGVEQNSQDVEHGRDG